MLSVGDKAPDFSLCDKDGKRVRLSDFKGKKVVIYFYPKDNTPGCTRQACAFASAFEEFKRLGITVIGISRDSVASHVKFAGKYNLPFILHKKPFYGTSDKGTTFFTYLQIFSKKNHIYTS